MGGLVFVRRGSVTRSQRGQSVVELAIALPVLLLTALGTVDMGRAFFTYITLRNAASEAALYGARNLAVSAATMQGRALNEYLPAPYRAGTTATAQRTGNCTAVGGTGLMSVGLSRQFSPISLDVLDFVGPGGTWEFTISPAAEARCMT